MKPKDQANDKKAMEGIAAEGCVPEHLRETFLALVENAFDVIEVINPDGEIQCVSPGVLRVLGYAPSEVIGHQAGDFVHPDDRTKARNVIERVSQKDGREQWDIIRAMHKDGSIRTVEFVAQNLFSHPVIQGIVLNYRDVTDRLQIQEALIRSEERYHKAFNSSPNSITISSLDDGRFLDVNEGFERMTGYRYDEVIGKTVVDITLWKKHDDRKAMTEILKRDGRVREYEAEFVTRDGDVLHCLVSAEIIELIGDQHMLAVTRDVTEQKETMVKLENTSERLRKERQELSEKNIALKQVLDHIESDKTHYRRRLIDQIEGLLLPVISKLRRSGGRLADKDIEAIEAGLKQIGGDSPEPFESKMTRLTPRELDICELIKQGLSTKEIAENLGLSPQTINKHRQVIRRKLDLNNRDINLATFLRSR